MPQKSNHLMQTSSALQIAALLWLIWVQSVKTQCPANTMVSFERISSVAIKDALFTVLYTAPNVSALAGGDSSPIRGMASNVRIPVTAECNNRCRRNTKCRAFLVDYSRHTCFSIEHSPTSLAASQMDGALVRSPTPIHLVPTHERTSYFEKICLNLPPTPCERAWVFERVLSHQIIGYDDKIIEDVPSRIKCQEHCLSEREFKCRSGEYDQLNMQCRLSATDRHLKASLFRATSSHIDYFENQCAPSANQCESFEQFEDLDLGRAEIMRPANSSDQCQQLCTQSIKAFACRSFTWDPASGKCYFNNDNSHMLAGGLDSLQAAPGLTYFQRNDCIDLKLDCDTAAMTLNLRTHEPFRGRMYVRDEPNLCETQGRSALTSVLSIPFGAQNRCAIRELPSRYSSVVVVQQHPLIQRKSDRYIKVVCDFQTANRTITSSYNVSPHPWTSTALINSTSSAPKIRLRITDKFGVDVTGAKLGDELYLRIEAETESVYDMSARSVLAKSGTTDESIVLIDRDGCPTDSRIFPTLKKLNRRTIVGKFDAFKFSSDVVVRFQVDVQFCLNQCSSVTCDSSLIPPLNLNTIPNQYAETYSPGSLPAPESPPQPLGEKQPLASPPPVSGLSSSNGFDQQNGRLNQSSYSYYSPNSIPDAPSFGYNSALSKLAQRNSISTPANQPSLLSQRNQAPVAATTSQTTNLEPTLTTSDPQIFEQARSAPSARANLAASRQLSDQTKQTAEDGEDQRQSSTKSAKKAATRRRRSVEPMPQEPSHVPLQREIIVEPAPSSSSSSGGKSEGKSSRRSSKSNSSKSTQASASRSAKSNSQDLLEDSQDYKMNSPDPSAMDLSQSQRINNKNEEATLLCTTRHSLVIGLVGFCAIQLLTIALCLASWLHSRRQYNKKFRPERAPPIATGRGFLF